MSDKFSFSEKKLIEEFQLKAKKDILSHCDNSVMK